MLYQSIGNCQSVEILPQGVNLIADNAELLITVYDSGVVRFQYQHRDRLAQGNHTDFSYSVVATPEQTPFEVTDTDEVLLISTNMLMVRIAKHPLRVACYAAQGGQLIHADEPAFGVGWLGTEVVAYKQLQENERFIGLGEKTGHLDRRGAAYTNWNTDYFAYPPNGDPLYCSTPFYIGLHNGTQYGIFFDNTHRTRFNFGASNKRFASFSATDGAMDYYFIYAPDMRGILRAYADLTGYMPMPPLWSLGLQQCRYSYYPESRVLNIAKQYRDHDLPADVLYLDIHYMDEYKVFTWNKQRFPNPKRFIKQLREMGFRLALIYDPGIKIQKGYAQYDKAKRKDLLVKYPDGTEYEADVWPGTCAFPDFTKPETRQWWGKQMENNIDEGVSGFWNDMNEPASWGQDTPDLIEFDFDGQKASHRQARNIYGMQMARATYEGAKKLLGERPFVLTRAGYCGIQRFAAVWTGDNTATDEHFLAGVRLVNSLGLTGIPFAGYDVGGFAGECTPELFARWIAVGALSPFFRCHSMINTRDAEPWSFGEEVLDIARNYIKLRYKLLPYIYSAFHEAAFEGLPIARSLALDYAHDELIYQPDFENQYLLGGDLMVCPIASNINIAKIYLPQGEWYDLYNDQYYSGAQQIYADTPKHRLPLFVRGGGILLMQDPLPHLNDLSAAHTLYIHLYKGEQNNNCLFYEDDGLTYQYEKQKYNRRIFSYNAKAQTLTISGTDGKFKSRFKQFCLYLHGFNANINVNLNDIPQEISTQTHRFIEPISNFDPFYAPTDHDKIENLPQIQGKWSDFEMIITLVQP